MHRPACFEPDPDKAPLDELCDVCRAQLRGAADRRPFCSICDLPISAGELFYRAPLPADVLLELNDGAEGEHVVVTEPLPDGGGMLVICGACTPEFEDQSEFMGAIA